jgi:hypothetical protein
LNLENNLVEITNDGIQVATTSTQYLRIPRNAGGTILDGTGEVYLFANTSTGYTLSCQNSSTTGDAVYINATNNAIYVAAGAVLKPGGGTWASISDRRVKKNEEQLTGSLNIIKQLKTYTMTRKIYEKVEEYVRKKYFLMFKKEDTLIIDEYESHFTVKKHETSSPLILGKEILD